MLEIRWNNGFWKVFDPNAYADVSMHETYALAVIAMAGR